MRETDRQIQRDTDRDRDSRRERRAFSVILRALSKKSFRFVYKVARNAMNGISQRNEMKIIAGNYNGRVQQTMLYFSRVAILEMTLTQIEASVTLVAFCWLNITIY